MILVLSIICITIVVCIAIRYGAMVHCQNIEYSIYKDLHKGELPSFSVRPYLYNGGTNDSFWGFVVYDEQNECIFKGVDSSNEHFIIYRTEERAEQFARSVRKMYGY